MMLCTTIAPASKLQMEMPYAKKVGIVAAAHRTTRPPNVRRATWRSSAWRPPARSWLCLGEKSCRLSKSECQNPTRLAYRA